MARTSTLWREEQTGWRSGSAVAFPPGCGRFSLILRSVGGSQEEACSPGTQASAGPGPGKHQGEAGVGCLDGQAGECRLGMACNASSVKLGLQQHFPGPAAGPAEAQPGAVLKGLHGDSLQEGDGSQQEWTARN